jgi:hypothetical protein
MAITIDQQVTGMATAYNPIDYVLSSTNTSETSFKFISDVYVNGVKRHRYLTPADPVYSNGFIDIASIIESYLTFDFDTSLNDDSIKDNPNSIVEVYVDFGEQYDVSGVITDFSGLATSQTLEVINGSLEYEDYIGFDYTEYLNDSTAATKFLTNAPVNRTIPSDMNAWLYMYNDNSTVYLDKVRVRTYDSNGTINGLFTFSNSYRGGGSYTDNHVRFPVGANLNNVTGVTVNSGALPILDADVASYDVQTFDNLITGTSEIRTYTRDLTCTGFDRYTLHFINELGGFDSFAFDLVHKINWSKEQSNYMTHGYTRSEDAVTRNLTKHQKRSYHTQTNKSIRLTSNWITEAESIWLRELFDSPIIYCEYPDGTLVAVADIDLNTYEEKQNIIDKTFNLEMTVNLAWNNYRQRR